MEKILYIKKKNSHVVEDGMVFNVAVSLKNLMSSKGFQYSMMLADVVIVNSEGNQVLTTEFGLNSSYDEISYQLDDPEEVTPTPIQTSHKLL